jgi:hypothetical protein
MAIKSDVHAKPLNATHPVNKIVLRNLFIVLVFLAFIGSIISGVTNAKKIQLKEKGCRSSVVLSVSFFRCAVESVLQIFPGLLVVYLKKYSANATIKPF